MLSLLQDYHLRPFVSIVFVFPAIEILSARAVACERDMTEGLLLSPSPDPAISDPIRAHSFPRSLFVRVR